MCTALLGLAIARWHVRPVAALGSTATAFAIWRPRSASHVASLVSLTNSYCWPRLRRALLLAQAEAGTAGYLDIDIAAGVREHITLWTPLAAEHHVRFAVKADKETRCAITPAAFGQIVDNLLTNALNVAPAGSTVTVAVLPVGDQVELHVIDQVPGLSEQERERAFDRFWRAPSALQASGSGLGLPIVRRLATSFGGEAELLPASHRRIAGIDAVVRLPRAWDARSRAWSASAPHGGGPGILATFR